MNRREFVRNSAITSIGLAMVPSFLGASHRAVEASGIVPIGMGGEHVRHGLFVSRAISNKAIPPWLQLFERHVFFGNGISAGQDDLHSFCFGVDGRMFTLARKENHLLFSSEEKTARFPQSDEAVCMYKNDAVRMDLKQAPAGSLISIERKGSQAIILLEGRFQTATGDELKAYDCLVPKKGENRGNMTALDASRFMVITRTA